MTTYEELQAQLSEIGADAGDLRVWGKIVHEWARIGGSYIAAIAKAKELLCCPMPSEEDVTKMLDRLRGSCPLGSRSSQEIARAVLALFGGKSPAKAVEPSDDPDVRMWREIIGAGTPRSTFADSARAAIAKARELLCCPIIPSAEELAKAIKTDVNMYTTPFSAAHDVREYLIANRHVAQPPPAQAAPETCPKCGGAFVEVRNCDNEVEYHHNCTGPVWDACQAAEQEAAKLRSIIANLHRWRPTGQDRAEVSPDGEYLRHGEIVAAMASAGLPAHWMRDDEAAKLRGEVAELRQKLQNADEVIEEWDKACKRACDERNKAERELAATRDELTAARLEHDELALRYGSCKTRLADAVAERDEQKARAEKAEADLDIVREVAEQRRVALAAERAKWAAR